MGAMDGVTGDPRWGFVMRRECPVGAGFVYSVRTTGVYCRPDCAARRAKPENVAFHESAAAAGQAGFRPCRRCRPDEPDLAARQAGIVEQACRMIEAAEEPVALAALARAAGMSRFHFQRVFKRVIGVTPKGYAIGLRGARMRAVLGREGTVTSAIFAAGFHANGGFYEKASGMLGMTPAAYRAGGGAEEIRFAVGVCSLGSILVACSGAGVCAILLGDDPDALVAQLAARFDRAVLVGGDATFERMVALVVGFVEAPGVGLDLPLDIRGTAFQQLVWRALRDVRVGETLSYTALAARIGRPAAVRAVAAACAANVLAVAIPCHRVVRIDGGLSGYRWGVDRKRALLRMEVCSDSNE